MSMIIHGNPLEISVLIGGPSPFTFARSGLKLWLRKPDPLARDTPWEALSALSHLVHEAPTRSTLFRFARGKMPRP